MRFFGKKSSDIAMFTFFCLGITAAILTIAAGSTLLAKLPSEKPKDEELAFLENLAQSLNCTLGSMKADLSKITFNCNDTLNALHAIDAQAAYFKSMHNDVQQAFGILSLILFLIPGCLAGTAGGCLVYGMLRCVARMIRCVSSDDVESTPAQPAAVELREIESRKGKEEEDNETEDKAEKKSGEEEKDSVTVEIKEGDEEKLLEQDTLTETPTSKTGFGKK